ncbi:hypothetical protein CLD20_14645 [Afifella sp. IM 167]|nr:hypothetical protein [Afifella sp. IM 167]
MKKLATFALAAAVTLAPALWLPAQASDAATPQWLKQREEAGQTSGDRAGRTNSDARTRTDQKRADQKRAGQKKPAEQARPSERAVQSRKPVSPTASRPADNRGKDRNAARWHRGEHYRGKARTVEDYRARGLKAPPKGYHWVRDGDEYLMVAISTGIVSAIVRSAGR